MKELELNGETFEEVVKTPGKVVMVDFWAQWCGPCRMLAPTVSLIAEEETDVIVGKVNVDNEPGLCVQFGINTIPTLLFFRDGILREKSVGVIGADAIREIIARI